MSTPSSLPSNPYKRGPIANGKKLSELNGTIHGRGAASQPNGKLEDNKPLHSYSSLGTVLLFFLWYLLTVVFNILNKKILNYFPYPYFVSSVQLLVGAIYCIVSWTFSIPKRAPCDSTLLKLLIPVAICHGLGHALGSVSFAKVPISFIQTIKVLEPLFNAAATQFILKQSVPLPLWLSLAPIVIGVTMASLTELSFNWTGFNGVMFSNVVFTYRNIYLKKAMTNMDSTNLYAYTSIIALFVCMPLAAIIEGPQLIQYGFRDVIAKVGLNKFLWDMFSAGIFYHLFNQFANNILERVTPLTLAVGNVSKRIVVIVVSIIIFGNKISRQAGIGTCIAISGVALYSWIKAKMEGRKLIKKAA